MSAIRIFSPPTQAVSPSTTQFVPPPVWQIENVSCPDVAEPASDDRLVERVGSIAATAPRASFRTEVDADPPGADMGGNDADL